MLWVAGNARLRYLRSRLSTKQMTAITVQDLYYRIVYDWSTMMPDEAIELLTQAAEKGHVDAQYELGNCYAMGTGVEQNAGKAVHWFEKAAAQKHTDAQWKLADLLREEQVRQTTQQRKESFSSIFGKALMSGSGVGNRSAFTTFFVHLLLAGLCAGFLCFFAPAQIRKDGTMTLHLPWGPSHTSILPDTERRANFASWCGIVGACGLIFVAVLAIRCIVGTKITVYENGITGTGVGKNFDYQVDFSLYNFQLEYDKITSVDATGTAVTIHASGMQYKCYADNPSEIQRVIVTQLHKHKK